MILRELYYFDDKTMEPVEDHTYDAIDDKSVVKVDDERKSRLTLKDINKARKASDNHKVESEKELNFIRQMYGLAAQAAAGGI
jgi:hypothetical protein|tara:strand:- start:170 stop:418 length:249 start_codon:yes stop_codon:yes gene_type:complete